MPITSTAELTRPVAFPDDPGVAIWSERRTFPVTAVYGVPTVFLVVLAVTVSPLPVRLLLVAGALIAVGLMVRAQRRSLIETYALSDRFLTVVQPGGGRVAVPVDSLRLVHVRGDKVRLEGNLGVVTLGFVRRQRALLRALEQVAPFLTVERDVTAFCPT